MPLELNWLVRCPTRSGPSLSLSSPLRQGDQNLELLQVQATSQHLESSRQLGLRRLSKCCHHLSPPSRRCSTHSGRSRATSASAPPSSRLSPPRPREGRTRDEPSKCNAKSRNKPGQRDVPNKGRQNLLQLATGRRSRTRRCRP